jgi:hypothetical protein
MSFYCTTLKNGIKHIYNLNTLSTIKLIDNQIFFNSFHNEIRGTIFFGSGGIYSNRDQEILIFDSKSDAEKEFDKIVEICSKNIEISNKN